MTYETMDWDSEAKRVKAAFGLECSVYFGFGDMDNLMTLYWGDPPSTNDIQLRDIQTRDGLVFIASYDTECRIFEILGPQTRFDSWVEVSWDGEVNASPVRMAYATQLARGLFHLGLLTPEAEAKLGVSVSAHEKAEWSLEYDKKNGEVTG